MEFLTGRGQEMKKVNVAMFSIFCLSLTFYSLLWPSYYQELLVSSAPGLLALRTIVCASMLAYVFRPQTRTYFAKTLMRAGGITLILFGLATFVSPGLFGASVTYVPIADTFIFLEGGIIASLLGIELPAHESRGMYRNLRLRLFTNIMSHTDLKKLTRSARATTH